MARIVVRRKNQLGARDAGDRPTAVGAYIFAGGFTLGVREHFDVLAHLEDGKFGVETARKNIPGLEVHVGHKSWPVGRYRGVDLVYCNPPCSPWSTAGINAETGERMDWRVNPLTSCVSRCFDLWRELRPAVWTFESVRQVYSKGREMLDAMVSECLDAGYDVTHVFTEAKNHGVPQHRKRYFMVAHRVEIEWAPPPRRALPTVDAALRQAKLDRDRDFAKGLPGPVAAVARHMGQGEGARKAWDRMAKSQVAMPDKRPSFLYDRLRGDGPSYTILGTPNKLHPREDRIVSTNETKALCGFPPTFRLTGGQANRYAELGRGVMPPVAEWLAGNLARAVQANRPLRGGTNEQAIDVQMGSILEKEIEDHED